MLFFQFTQKVSLLPRSLDELRLKKQPEGNIRIEAMMLRVPIYGRALDRFV